MRIRTTDTASMLQNANALTNKRAIWDFLKTSGLKLSNLPAACQAFQRNFLEISGTLSPSAQTFRTLTANRSFLSAVNQAGLRLFAIGTEEAVLLAEKEARLEIGGTISLFSWVSRRGHQSQITVASFKYFDFDQYMVVADGSPVVAPSDQTPPLPGEIPSRGCRFNLCGMVVGQGEAMRSVIEVARRAAEFNSPVIITGETGTGKELVAQIIHANSERRSGVFISINCAAFSAGLIESELFGHEAGSFTGALRQRIGIFEEATAGTVFLDEIGDLPLEMQVKLLRVLQGGSFRRVGSNTTLTTGARIITATNKDLAKEVQAGRFREDLYYRIQVIHIPLPPLRGRTEDITNLAQYFLAQFNATCRRNITGFSDNAWEALLAHAWPGNVRELASRIEQAVILANGSVIEANELRIQAAGATATLVLPLASTEEVVYSSIIAKIIGGDETLMMALERIKNEAVLAALEQADGNKTVAAARLGISLGGFKKIYRRMNRPPAES